MNPQKDQIMNKSKILEQARERMSQNPPRPFHQNS